jgi:hypothetical protein
MTTKKKEDGDAQPRRRTSSGRRGRGSGVMGGEEEDPFTVQPDAPRFLREGGRERRRSSD